MTVQPSSNGQRKPQQRQGKPQQQRRAPSKPQQRQGRPVQPTVEPQVPRYDKIRYDSYSFEKDGKKITKVQTEAREAVRRLTCDRVVELMMFDRNRTPATTPKGRPYSIMCWSDKQQYAAWRYIAELCYGPLDQLRRTLNKSSDRKTRDRVTGYSLGWHADTSVLTEFQIDGIHQIFLYVVASEMQSVKEKDKRGRLQTVHRSLAPERTDSAVEPFAVSEEPDWYVEGFEEALNHVENRAGKNLNKAVDQWLKNVRAQALMSIKPMFKSMRAKIVDQQCDEKEELERTLSEDELTDVKTQLQSAFVGAS